MQSSSHRPQRMQSSALPCCGASRPTCAEVQPVNHFFCRSFGEQRFIEVLHVGRDGKLRGQRSDAVAAAVQSLSVVGNMRRMRSMSFR